MKLKSRKFLFAVASCVFIACLHFFVGLPVAIMAKWVAAITLGYMGVEGTIDVVAKLKKQD